MKLLLLATASWLCLSWGSSPVQRPSLGQIPSTQTSIFRGIPYVTNGSPEQKLDVFLPKGKRFATVIFTYGGGWHAPRSKGIDQIANAFTSMGFGCVLISHRLGPKDRFPAQAEDLATAFAWTKQHIADYGGDSRAIFLVGHSSGAHLSLLIATDPQYLRVHKLRLADIAGVVGLSTPTNLEPTGSAIGFGDSLMAGRGAETFNRDPGLMRRASPIAHIARGMPRTILVVGDNDFPALPGDAATFARAANKTGATVTVLKVKNCDHMGTVAGLLDTSSPIRQKVLAFLSANR